MHTQGRYNMINGGVSLTLINYNQIKDFISLNLGSVFGHTVNQRCMIFALHDFPFFFSIFPSHKSLLWNKVVSVCYESSWSRKTIKTESRQQKEICVFWYVFGIWDSQVFCLDRRVSYGGSIQVPRQWTCGNEDWLNVNTSTLQVWSDQCFWDSVACNGH